MTFEPTAFRFGLVILIVMLGLFGQMAWAGILVIVLLLQMLLSAVWETIGRKWRQNYGDRTKDNLP